ncbi:MAG: branched-chain-amino-acid transaminase [Promethearchaeota archaeon]
MTKNYLVYVNGGFIPSQEASVSVFDHGLLYGDGIFEGIRVYDGVVFQLDAHLTRLYQDAKAIRLAMPLAKKALEEAVLETLRRNKLVNAYIRLVVTRGTGDLGLNPRKCPHPTVIIIAKPVDALHGAEAKQRGLHTIIAATRRHPVDTTSHEIKSLNYLNSILAILEANTQGADDAIMLDSRGFVAEATGTTLFAVQNGQLYTPPLYASILDGITRRFIISLARELNYPVTERDLTVFQLRNVDEIFLCGTMGEVVPVVSIDGQPVGVGKPGPITRHLLEEYSQRVKDPQHGTPIQSRAAPAPKTM